MEIVSNYLQVHLNLYATIAQLVVRLICNQKVADSRKKIDMYLISFIIAHTLLLERL